MVEKTEQERTERERKLLEYIRQFGYGRLVIFVEGGQPARIVKAEQNIKL